MTEALQEPDPSRLSRRLRSLADAIESSGRSILPAHLESELLILLDQTVPATTTPSMVVDFCNVLIVEDDPLAAHILHRLLEKMHCRPTWMNGGEAALKQLRHQHFDLVFMDCSMPGMDGFETTERIRSSGNTTLPIIAVTASNTAETKPHCLRSGMNDVLIKPVNASLLKATIDRWLSGRVLTGADQLHNLSSSLRNTGYPLAALHTVASVWLERYPAWFSQLKQAITTSSPKELQETCYQLRVGLTLLGMEGLYTELRQLELHATHQQWHAARLQLPFILHYLSNLQPTVVSWLEQHPLADTPAGVQPGPDPTAATVMVIDPNPLIQALVSHGGLGNLHLLHCDDIRQAMRKYVSLPQGTIDAVLFSEQPHANDPLFECLDLLQADPTLSILVHAHFPTRALVDAALKTGLFGVLAKPADAVELRTTLQRAIEATRHNRQLQSTHLAARRIGSAQSRLLNLQSAPIANIRSLIYNRPQHEAGGDFWVHLHPHQQRHCFYLSDVSGHDIEAAFISAYLHGLIRATQHLQSLPVREALVEFNHFLTREWNTTSISSNAVIHKSVACCAAEIDRITDTLRFFLCGSCLPIVFLKKGRIRYATHTTGIPLGWFDNCEIESSTYTASEVEGFFIWSDGVESLASCLGANPTTVAHLLLQNQDPLQSPAWVQQAEDDLLVAWVGNEAETSPSSSQCVFFESYSGDQASEIDTHQDCLKSSLLLHNPQFSEELLHDMQLCYREALLNAMQHGCGNRVEHHAHVAVLFDKSSNSYLIQVWDDGMDHTESIYDFNRHEVSDHRGLSLIRAFAATLEIDTPQKLISMRFNR
jgi:CheY-like chemotaxis protein/serine phosphatase RsbU (regulator of sigma subunit)/anti-sigma regulatory factor (Ser/Thr protein kinase)